MNAGLFSFIFLKKWEDLMAKTFPFLDTHFTLVILYTHPTESSMIPNMSFSPMTDIFAIAFGLPIFSLMNSVG
jgi:hypothetical protein